MMGRLLLLLAILVFIGIGISNIGVEARRILLDNDVDTDDVFALIYLLKQDKTMIDLKAVTINANSWTDAGHAVNQVYDILYMMGRDDIPVGVGGEGGILPDGTIQKNVGGYLPIIDQGLSTVGNCRYRQAIPVGAGGRLDIDTNYGIRRGFLPQGKRKYSPLRQPTAQQVLIDTISAGPTTVFITGALTNLAIFLMSNPHLKKNIEHIFIMGGGVRSSNPTGCCPKDAGSSCVPQQCGDRGNLFSGYLGNPYAEFNMFCDPFAAYQVLHSGIPITLVPLDATNTIPINRKFLREFERRQHTYEAQYCLQSLKIIHDTWFDDQFYTSYFMWDSFMSGVAASIIRNGFPPDGQNEFAEMTYLNITVVTSNEPYGVSDGSNPFFDGRRIPKFNLEKGGAHSGHVQMGIQDPFCIVNNGTETGRCQDGYTKEISGPDAVQVLVAQKAKPNQNTSSPLNRQFFANFLDVLNSPRHSGLFNFATQFPFYKPTLYKPDFLNRTLGKPVVFDMDMSAGDFLTLIYLLKVPVENLDLKGILVSGTGWANAATIDVVYDVLHMMGRDDIPVGLGSATPVGNPSFGCKYVKAIPHGSGGFLDSDTLFGLARNLPRSPRRYSAENSVTYGAPRNTSHPSRRQPLALEVWRCITSDLHSKGGHKITILTNGPLTNLAKIILTDKNATSLIQEVYTVGGHVTKDSNDIGNVFTVPSNKYSEFNFFLDPIAVDIVLKSKLRVTLIPLDIQRTVASFPLMLGKFQSTHGTPEAMFTRNLLSTMYSLQQKNQNYYHMEVFLGEILGAVFLANDPILQASTFVKSIAVLAGDLSSSGQTVLQRRGGNIVKILNNLDSEAYYNHFTNLLSDETQSAVIGSFEEQKRKWSKRTNVHREAENGLRSNVT